jgi:maleate isomerase
MVTGEGSDRQILDLVKQITPTPASTVLTAVIRACQTLGLKRVVMASPFPEDQDEGLVRFLAHDGIEVIAFRGLGCPNSNVIWELPPETGYDLSTALCTRAPGRRRYLYASNLKSSILTPLFRLPYVTPN